MLKTTKATINFDAVEGIVMALVTAGLLLGVGLYALQKVNDLLPVNTTAILAVNKTINAIGGIADWFGILVAIGVIALILFVLYSVRPTMSGGNR